MNENALAAEYSSKLAGDYANVNDYYHMSFSETGLSEAQRAEYQKMDGVFAVGENIAISER